MKTHAVKAGEIERSWYVVDANGRTLGRLATEIAGILRGKHKPTFSPHLDVGDYVVVVNAEKVRLSGSKAETKVYHHHSGYPGGLKTEAVADVLRKFPDRVIERAVKGMLPHNALGEKTREKLKIYAGPHHPHVAQRPTEWAPAPIDKVRPGSGEVSETR